MLTELKCTSLINKILKFDHNSITHFIFTRTSKESDLSFLRGWMGKGPKKSPRVSTLLYRWGNHESEIANELFKVTQQVVMYLG